MRYAILTRSAVERRLESAFEDIGGAAFGGMRIEACTIEESATLFAACAAVAECADGCALPLHSLITHQLENGVRLTDCAYESRGGYQIDLEYSSYTKRGYFIFREGSEALKVSFSDCDEIRRLQTILGEWA